MSIKKEFLKIKIKDERVHLDWQLKREDETYDKYSLESKDTPHPSFTLKLLELRNYVNDICDLRLHIDEFHKLKISSISINYAGEKHIMGAAITALKDLPNRNSPLVVNTPYLIEDYYSDQGDPNSLLPSKLVLLIYEIFDYADDYIQGKRAQLNFFTLDKDDNYQPENISKTKGGKIAVKNL